MDDPTNNDQLSIRILSYFVQHGDVCDSVEGLVRWRLLEESVLEHLQETQAALERLVAEEYVSEERRPGLAPMYSIPPERRAAALQRLAELEASQKATLRGISGGQAGSV